LKCDFVGKIKRFKILFYFHILISKHTNNMLQKRIAIKLSKIGKSKKVLNR